MTCSAESCMECQMKPPITLLRRAVKNWNSEYADKELNRRNQQAWLRAVQRLGDKWLLAQPVKKEA